MPAKPRSDGRNPGFLPVFSLEQKVATFSQTTSDHGPEQRRQFQGKEDTEGWGKTNPQSQEAVRCDGCFEETRNSFRRKVGFFINRGKTEEVYGEPLT